jgi:hypothetical protein
VFVRVNECAGLCANVHVKCDEEALHARLKLQMTLCNLARSLPITKKQQKCSILPRVLLTRQVRAAIMVKGKPGKHVQLYRFNAVAYSMYLGKRHP